MNDPQRQRATAVAPFDLPRGVRSDRSRERLFFRTRRASADGILEQTADFAVALDALAAGGAALDVTGDFVLLVFTQGVIDIVADRFFDLLTNTGLRHSCSPLSSDGPA